METKLLIIGKGDNIITMILDNLYSNRSTPEIHIFNNLNLPILNTFEHDEFVLRMSSPSKIIKLEDLDLNEYDKFVLGVYQPPNKINIIESLKPDINKFTNIIHSGLDISHMSKLGRGILINSKVSIAAHTNIGDYVTINRNVSIGHHTNIGDYCSINPGVNIAGNVTIGEATTIGMGTNVLDSRKIGRNTIIGAGSVVTKDIPDNVIAYGNPCKIIRENK
jgi:sugar O-acyltransferase (sialic acid O-acetyltransferase NeuD family)